MRLSFLVSGFLVLAAVGSATGQEPQRKILRGVVASLTGDKLTLNGRDGRAIQVTLAPSWSVRVAVPIGIEAIHTGSFIGTAQMPQADGSGRSLEVHVFPPGVKSGEGERDWDSQPGARMTNGTVEGEIIAEAKGREVILGFPGGNRKILIPPDVPIVQFTAGDQAQIKPGVAVFIVAMPDGAGGLKTSGVAIGRNGAPPPM